jgi:hypothetical protein
MKQFRNNVIRAGLGALYFTGAHYLLRPIFAGVGAVFMLHHVRPPRDAEFQPNHHLEVAPEFLGTILAYLRARNIDIITMDEVHRRLIERNFSRRFACFTLDDGYRDNRDFALPVMREFDAPLTVYVASDFAEGAGRLWWVALEMVIAKASSIEVKIGNATNRLDTSTPAAKQAAFDRAHDWLRALPGEHDIQREISALCARHGVDESAICRELCMSPSARIPSRIAILQSRPGMSPQARSPPAASGSKARCSVPFSTSPIPMATGSLPALASSRWRRRPDSRPR